MFITRECDYGVRIVRALSGGGRMAVGTVCDAEHIPQPYAYKIIKKLEKADIVKGYRGVAGGYELATPLEKLSLYDIIVAVEDDLSINGCLQDGFECPNNCGGRCTVHNELWRIQIDLLNGLKERNMADILAIDTAN